MKHHLITRRLCLAYQGGLALAVNTLQRVPVLHLAAYCLFVIYVLAGTFGRSPWKADEPYSFAIAWNVAEHHHWLIPTIGADPFMEKPPLMYWLGALCIRLLPWLPPYDAVRVAVVLCLVMVLGSFGWALTLLYRENTSVKRSAADWHFCGMALLTANVGLAEHIHKFTADVGQLAGSMMALTALMSAVAVREKNCRHRAPLFGTRPEAVAGEEMTARRHMRWSGITFGIGIGIAFLSKGLLVPGVMLAVWGCSLLWLPVLRGRNGMTFILYAAFVMLPFVIPWPLALYHIAPNLFHEWFWVNNIGRFVGFTSLGGHDNPLRNRVLAVILGGAPASLILIAGVSAALAKPRRWLRWCALRHSPARLVASLYLVIGLMTLISAGSMRDIYLMPFLPAMAMLALTWLPPASKGRSVPARVLDGFFLLLLVLITITAVQLILTGRPQLLHWLWADTGRELPVPFWLNPSRMTLAICIMILALWCWLVCQPRANLLRSWAVGMTTVWSVTFILLLPWLDAARSYQSVFTRLSPHLTPQHCLATEELGESELGMLYYVTGIAGKRIYAGHSGQGVPGHLNKAALRCDYLLVQQHKKRHVEPPEKWRPIWSGRRPADDQFFILYHLEPNLH